MLFVSIILGVGLGARFFTKAYLPARARMKAGDQVAYAGLLVLATGGYAGEDHPTGAGPSGLVFMRCREYQRCGRKETLAAVKTLPPSYYRRLARLTATNSKPGHYRPDDKLLAFLEAL